MLKYIQGITNESIIEIFGKVKVADRPIETCTVTDLELELLKVYAINRSTDKLPLLLADASTVFETLDDVRKLDEETKEVTKEKTRVIAGLKTRFDNRVIDLRTTTSQSLMRVQSAVCTLFREYLLSLDFIEIHTPKIIPGTSEGGAEVFKLDYFGRDACLAQSPQLYK